MDGDGNELNVSEVVGEAPEGEEVPDFSAQPAKAAAPIPQTAESAKPAAESTELFDPSTAKVEEVLNYASSVDEAERTRILEAEKAGKARKSIISKLS